MFSLPIGQSSSSSLIEHFLTRTVELSTTIVTSHFYFQLYVTLRKYGHFRGLILEDFKPLSYLITFLTWTFTLSRPKLRHGGTFRHQSSFGPYVREGSDSFTGTLSFFLTSSFYRTSLKEHLYSIVWRSVCVIMMNITLSRIDTLRKSSYLNKS